MEDWLDAATVIGESLRLAAAFAVIAGLAMYSVLRVIHRASRFRAQYTWKTDLRPTRWFTLATFVIVFLPAFFLGSLTFGMCGTNGVQEFVSSDGKHKIAVYGIDCGATTDCSLVVSLLDASEHVPKHSTMRVLYSHYHQEPDSSDFEVRWRDSKRVLVRVVGSDGTPVVTQGGVTVEFEKLR